MDIEQLKGCRRLDVPAPVNFKYLYPLIYSMLKKSVSTIPSQAVSIKIIISFQIGLNQCGLFLEPFSRGGRLHIIHQSQTCLTQY